MLLTAPGTSGFVFGDPANRQRSEPVRGIGYFEREIGITDADDYMLWLFRGRIVIFQLRLDLC
jgi:hypothetical protein